MAKYSATGAAGVASATAATAGIILVDNAATTLASPKIYEFSVGPGAAAEDSNYTMEVKRQTTRGTWSSVTPAPLDAASGAAVSTAGRASTAAGSASTVLMNMGFNQRGGIRWVAVPGGELYINRANSNGIMLGYVVVQGTAVNYGAMLFDE